MAAETTAARNAAPAAIRNANILLPLTLKQMQGRVGAVHRFTLATIVVWATHTLNMPESMGSRAWVSELWRSASAQQALCLFHRTSGMARQVARSTLAAAPAAAWRRRFHHSPGATDPRGMTGTLTKLCGLIDTLDQLLELTDAPGCDKAHTMPVALNLHRIAWTTQCAPSLMFRTPCKLASASTCLRQQAWCIDRLGGRHASRFHAGPAL